MDNHRGSLAKIRLVAHPVGAAGDVLEHPVILAFGQQRQVAPHDLLGDGRHVVRRLARLDSDIAQGTVEAVDVLLQAEQLAIDRALRVEGAVAPSKTAVAERDDDMALRDIVTIEVGNAFIGSIGHRVLSRQFSHVHSPRLGEKG